MLRRYTFWLTAAILFQFLTAILHGVSLFLRHEPASDAERQMFEMIGTYRLDMGSGFTPTFGNLFTALGACYCLLCLFGGLVTGYLLVIHSEPKVMRGVIGINLFIFGVCFLLMAVFTFLPPILFSGLIFANLLAAFIFVPNIEADI